MLQIYFVFSLLRKTGFLSVPSGYSHLGTPWVWWKGLSVDGRAEEYDDLINEATYTRMSKQMGE